MSRKAAEILQRVGTSAEIWQARLKALRKGRLLGASLLRRVVDFAASRARLREVALGLGLRAVPNLGGCPAP